MIHRLNPYILALIVFIFYHYLNVKWLRKKNKHQNKGVSIIFYNNDTYQYTLKTTYLNRIKVYHINYYIYNTPHAKILDYNMLYWLHTIAKTDDFSLFSLSTHHI